MYLVLSQHLPAEVVLEGRVRRISMFDVDSRKGLVFQGRVPRWHRHDPKICERVANELIMFSQRTEQFQMQLLHYAKQFLTITDTASFCGARGRFACPAVLAFSWSIRTLVYGAHWQPQASSPILARPSWYFFTGCAM